jgi:hypothetical protein
MITAAEKAKLCRGCRALGRTQRRVARRLITPSGARRNRRCCAGACSSSRLLASAVGANVPSSAGRDRLRRPRVTTAAQLTARQDPAGPARQRWRPASGSGSKWTNRKTSGGETRRNTIDGVWRHCSSTRQRRTCSPRRWQPSSSLGFETRRDELGPRRKPSTPRAAAHGPARDRRGPQVAAQPQDLVPRWMHEARLAKWSPRPD